MSPGRDVEIICPHCQGSYTANVSQKIAKTMEIECKKCTQVFYARLYEGNVSFLTELPAGEKAISISRKRVFNFSESYGPLELIMKPKYNKDYLKYFSEGELPIPVSRVLKEEETLDHRDRKCERLLNCGNVFANLPSFKSFSCSKCLYFTPAEEILTGKVKISAI